MFLLKNWKRATYVNNEIIVYNVLIKNRSYGFIIWMRLFVFILLISIISEFEKKKRFFFRFFVRISSRITLIIKIHFSVQVLK